METEMETQLIASFNDLDHLEQAVEELRGQGALDIRVKCAPVEVSDEIGALTPEMNYSVNVYVERSRYRQAEDTIIRNGGRFQLPPQA